MTPEGEQEEMKVVAVVVVVVKIAHSQDSSDKK